MLTISDRTFAAFGAVEDEKFAERVARFLREEVAELRDEPIDAMVAAVRGLMVRARSYGLTSERGVVVFATAAAFLGLDFDTDFPAANAVLAAGDMAEAQKIGWIESWSTEMFERLDG